MIRKLYSSILSQRQNEARAELHRNMIRREAQIGGQLFGQIPAGVRREFFCLDTHTWVWHEEWKDNTGSLQSRTTRYDVRPDRIIKSQNGRYHAVNLNEATNLVRAIQEYVGRVKSELYGVIA
ncbi:MAG: hypothetical protein AAB459_04565 [Patescibacteria group bacterium]